jgi:hypothetical protein
MKLRTKIFAPLFVVLMLGMATSAFADLGCTVTVAPTTTVGATVSGPISRGILNLHTQELSDLLFTCIGGNATGTSDGSVTLNTPGLQITTNPSIVGTALTGHRITITNGVNTTPSLGVIFDTTRVDTGTRAVSYTQGLIALTIPALANPLTTCPGPAGCQFTVSNVVVSAAGATVSGQQINMGGNVISVIGNTTMSGFPINVLGAVLPLLNSTTLPPALVTNTNPAQFLPDGSNPPTNASCNQACADARARFRVTVSEDHNDSWKSAAQTWTNGVGNPSANGTNVLYTFSGMLPGSIISNCVIDNNGYTGSTWALTGSGIAGNNGTTTLVAELLSQTLGELGNQNTLTLSCGTSTANPAYLKGASTGNATNPITVSMSTAPTGLALDPGPGGGTNTPYDTGGVPRFSTTGGTVGPVTVINFIGGATAKTTMLIPFVTASGAAAPPAGTFNTGVAIANTTKDTNFGTDAQGAAVDTSGNVAFHFYPMDGSAGFSITPTTGFGLANGVIPAGGTFLGNFSDILKAGNQSGSFSGYVFIQANFSHAHGSAFVYGGGAADRLTSAQDVLVISDPTTFSRNTNFSVLPFAELTSK